MIERPSLTLGVEEEYLIVDKVTRDLVVDPPPELMIACEAELGERVTNEFLKSQIEIGTKPCASVSELRTELKMMRRVVAEACGQWGFAPIASSTHPFARWTQQRHTPKDRYDGLARDFTGPARRLLICGMHVHAGIEDPELRIDLMNQVTYFLPHLLALTTSSPFWQGQDMGMACYRLTVFDALPRTGLPDRFASHGEYRRLVEQLVRTGSIEDATKIWWDIRPSDKFPTLEMRIADVCTSVDDAISIAALYQCLLSMLFRLRERNQRWRIYPSTLVGENRWRAQRYGIRGGLVDFGKGEVVPAHDLIDELVDLVHPDSARLKCASAVEHAREIADRGTSAERQLRIYNAAIDNGAGTDEALREVVDWLIGETVRGI